MRHARAFLTAVLLTVISALASGCRNNDLPSPSSDSGTSGPNPTTQHGANERPPVSPRSTTSRATSKGTPLPPPPSTPLGGSPADEDPMVVEYFKKKNWLLYRDQLISDGRPVIYANIEDRKKSGEKIDLTVDDFKMIAKSKTLQILDLSKVKNTSDESLKIVSSIATMEGLVAFSETFTDVGVKHLASSPKLRTLVIMFAKLNGACFEAFAGSKTLEALHLEYIDGITDDGCRHIAKIPNLNALKITAGFGEQKLTAAGIKAIVDVRVPAKFEFDKKFIDDELFQSLVTKGWLYGPASPGSSEKKPATALEVQSINLEGSRVTDKGLQAILNCVNAKHLFLGRTGISDETMKKMSNFKKLEYLSLEKAKITAAGLEAIASAPIKHIALEGCELSEEMFQAFAKMPNLEELWLSDTKMKPDWLQHISKLPKLKELNLRSAAFDDAAVKHVATMPALKDITLNNTKLSDKGLLELLKLPNLKSIGIDGTDVTKEAYLKAKKDHPKVSMSYYRYDH